MSSPKSRTSTNNFELIPYKFLIYFFHKHIKLLYFSDMGNTKLGSIMLHQQLVNLNLPAVMNPKVPITFQIISKEMYVEIKLLFIGYVIEMVYKERYFSPKIFASTKVLLKYSKSGATLNFLLLYLG